jgi:hypothetical protein
METVFVTFTVVLFAPQRCLSSLPRHTVTITSAKVTSDECAYQQWAARINLYKSRASVIYFLRFQVRTANLC